MFLGVKYLEKFFPLACAFYSLTFFSLQIIGPFLYP